MSTLEMHGVGWGKEWVMFYLELRTWKSAKKELAFGEDTTWNKKWVILGLGKASKKQKGWDLGREESLNLGKEVRLEVEWPR